MAHENSSRGLSVVDAGSFDKAGEMGRGFGAQFFVETWKCFVR
ncbi:MAG: hypothetical protein WC373_02940 [Smithella sp.]